jgi:hypothetical protein
MKRTVSTLPLLLFTAGCVHQLPSDEATAFKTLASANRDSFEALAKTEDQSVKMFAQRRVVEGNGFLAPEGCHQAKPEETCALVWHPSSGVGFRLEPTAANTRALIGAIADYGDQMATLAEAKDVTDAQGSLDGVSTAVKGLMTAVGIPAIGAVVVDAAIWLQKGRMVDKRRRALLQAAETADPAVQLAAKRMGEITGHLRGNLMMTAGERIADASLATAPGPENKTAAGERRAALADMIQAAQDLQSARELSTDYSSLATAHSKLVTALRDPRRRTSEVISDLKTFLSLLESAKAAAKPQPSTEEK